MTSQDDIIFCEQQSFAFWLRSFIVFSMLVAMGVVLFELFQKRAELKPANLPTAIAVIIIISVVMTLLFYSAKLKTQVQNDGLYIKFFPFHLRYKKFSADNIAQCFSRQYKPIREYGGWGIRCSWCGAGKAYNVSGNQGVQIIFENGKKLLIGSQKPQELALAIKKIMPKQ